ncbi:DUF262 domain-containing protein [Nocardioides cavernaquae]|uniref:DUF262 domain-containing protein n=1 Tax=Nocardioides cavernaquae TaxID=2321396 RepID=A0A3A5HD53_9ACTN|nr:DUF262 domain-containing protein [Nocardioides cavernaquae]RJS47425.1 DUF262 domain-containing protein [Nocardioides cavernaquae]
MSLRDQIESRAKEIRTDGYSMSIGEVIGLCNEGDIDIHPEFQRIFRWKAEQKSRLIESILLGIPIPPIFVSQREDGVWDVIDGVQRLSTVLQFTGNYVNEDGKRQPGFPLVSGEYLTEMRGFTWTLADDSSAVSVDSGQVALVEDEDEDEDEDEGQDETELLEFDDVLKRDFKRAKLEFRIITKGSDESAKYDLFQRLNSGSVLSPQEARNCLMVMINRDMFALTQTLASDEPFGASIQLSERQEEQAYRQELVLRFFAQKDFNGPDKELPQEFGEYLTTWMRGVATGRGISSADEANFRTTFELLVAAESDDVFRKWDGARHMGPFSISCYEFITSGVSYNLERWVGAKPEELSERIRNVWSDDVFKAWSGTGMSTRRRVPRLVNRARTYFA